jgi:hypothetical protein
LESKRDQAEFDVKKRQIRELESLADRGYLDLFYYDESHFNLTPNIPYAWQKKGQTIKLACAKSKSFNVAGFYSKVNEFFYQFREMLISVLNWRRAGLKIHQFVKQLINRHLMSTNP